jgi:hypothetical protein
MVAAHKKLDEAINKAEEEDRRNPQPGQAAVINEAKDWRRELYWAFVMFGTGKGPSSVYAEVGGVTKTLGLSGNWEKMGQEIVESFKSR